jgi:7-cyano-7-deazaguanosine (preQ0) biosynthesis protein QueE
VSAPTASDATGVGARLAVAEVFGPTFQGEGPSMGRRCSFLRLSGCNLRCTWCDTPYTWDWSRYDPAAERTMLDVPAILDTISGHGTDMLVVSGGEPLLQQRRLVPLLALLAERGMRIEVETAGTVSPLAEVTAAVAQLNVSPKLRSSGNPQARRLRPAALADLQATGKAAWKFVAVDAGDVDEIAELVARFGMSPVYVMPEGTSAEVVLERSRELAGPVLARGWNLTSRLHVLLYGNRRGV